MLLHEAVQKARKDLGLSQKRLSELAGIQRRQLATLESGGNVTLATLRKVLVHLPNLESFTLDTVTASVRRQVSQEERQKAVDASMKLMGTALQGLVAALKQGVEPSPEAIRSLQQANEVLYEGMGYSTEDLARDRQELAAQREAEESMADGIADLIQTAQADVFDQLERDGLLRDVEEEEGAHETPARTPR